MCLMSVYLPDRYIFSSTVRLFLFQNEVHILYLHNKFPNHKSLNIKFGGKKYALFFYLRLKFSYAVNLNTYIIIHLNKFGISK